MLGRIRVPAASEGHEYYGDPHASARLVVDLGHVVVDLVHANAKKVYEHQLDDRPHALHGRSDPGPDEGRLRYRRVHDSVGTEPFEQAGRRAEDAAQASDVLAHEEDRVVALHLLRDALDEGT